MKLLLLSLLTTVVMIVTTLSGDLPGFPARDRREPSDAQTDGAGEPTRPDAKPPTRTPTFTPKPTSTFTPTPTFTAMPTSVPPTATPVPLSPTPTSSAGDVPRYAVFELSFTYPSPPLPPNGNPWEQVTVSATFTAPSGAALNIDGFYYDTNDYRVRFTPAEVGAYRYTVTLNGPSGAQSASGAFNVAPSANKGFVRKSAGNPYRLVFSDGSIFNGIGFNDCWNPPSGVLTGYIGDAAKEPAGEGGQVPIETYMQKYGSAGAGFNVLRWNPGNCSFDIYETISTSGSSYLVAEGKLGDQLLVTAKQNGFHIMLALFRSNPPYPDAVGNSAKEDAIRRALRYAMARYGAYVSLWELTNETSETKSSNSYISDKWLQFVRGVVRGNDPYARLITNSNTRDGDLSALNLDLRSPHIYYRSYDDWDNVTNTTANFSNGTQMFAGEVGNGNDPQTGKASNWDTQSAARVRMRAWTDFLAGGVIVFWNTSFSQTCTCGNVYLGSAERAYVRVLQNLTAAGDPTATASKIYDLNGAAVYRLGAASSLMVYARTAPGANSTTLTFTLNVPFAGTATWLDPKTGNTVASAPLNSGTQSVTTPPFSEDILLVVK